jgi:hypothetical protein
LVFGYGKANALLQADSDQGFGEHGQGARDLSALIVSFKEL